MKYLEMNAVWRPILWYECNRETMSKLNKHTFYECLANLSDEKFKKIR